MVLENHELMNPSTAWNTHQHLSGNVMLFGIYDICKLLCSNSRGSLVGHVLKDRITENIRLVSYIELGIFHEDYSRFVWLIDIFICLCRVERKFIWSPTDHISYTASARV